jgi:putative ATP-binding cassette transporter
VLNAVIFIGVLWSVGGSLPISAFGVHVTVPGYLVLTAVVYSAVLAMAMMLVGRRLAHVVEEKNQAEAELKSTAAHLRHIGDGTAISKRPLDEHSFLTSALDRVVVRWRELCHQLMRTTFITHLNSVVAPVFSLVICIPKYVDGAMTLGEVVQAAAAFVIVHGALNWFVDNYQRLADLLSSVNRVSSLVVALDRLALTADFPDTSYSIPSESRAGHVSRPERAGVDVRHCAATLT